MISEVSLYSSIDGGQMNYWRTACFIGIFMDPLPSIFFVPTAMQNLIFASHVLESETS